MQSKNRARPMAARLINPVQSKNRARPMAARFINPVQSKNRARPMAARLKNKQRAEQEPRSAHGRALKKKSKPRVNHARPMAARIINLLPTYQRFISRFVRASHMYRGAHGVSCCSLFFQAKKRNCLNCANITRIINRAGHKTERDSISSFWAGAVEV